MGVRPSPPDFRVYREPASATAMPAVLAPAGVEYGEPGSWVTVPPLTANAATVWLAASLRYSVSIVCAEGDVGAARRRCR